jgi:hypothetical protein
LLSHEPIAIIPHQSQATSLTPSWYNCISPGHVVRDDFLWPCRWTGSWKQHSCGFLFAKVASVGQPGAIEANNMLQFLSQTPQLSSRELQQLSTLGSEWFRQQFGMPPTGASKRDDIPDDAPHSCLKVGQNANRVSQMLPRRISSIYWARCISRKLCNLCSCQAIPLSRSPSLSPGGGWRVVSSYHPIGFMNRFVSHL